jgi:hypothetical protein
VYHHRIYKYKFIFSRSICILLEWLSYCESWWLSVTGFAPGAGAIPQQMHPPSTVLNTVDQGERNAEPPRAIEVASCSFTASHLSRDLDSPVAQNMI